MMFIIHKFQCCVVLFVYRNAADTDVIQQITAHLIRRDAFGIVEESLDRRAVGGDHNSLSPVLPHDPHDRFAHAPVDFDHRLSARRPGVASVLIEHIHSVKLRILRLYLLFSPAVYEAEIDLHDARLHQHGNLMVLSRKTVFQCPDSALQRAGHPQINMNILEVFLKTGSLSLSYLIERIICLSLIAKRLIPGCGAMAHQI